MDPKKVRKLLGLPEDATDEDVTKAVDAKLAEVEKPAEKPAEAPPAPVAEETPPAATPTIAPPAPAAETPKLPDGVVTIDSTTLEDLRVAAARGAEAHQTLRIQARDTYLEGAVRAGKFAPSRREHFAKLYDADEEGTRQTIDALAANVIPVQAKGHEGGTDTPADETWAAAEAAWFPELGAVRGGKS